MEYVYGERSSQGVQFVTTDGTPLYELGLGLGPLKNGRDCERCQHKGFTEEKSLFGSRLCTNCDWDGQTYGDVTCRSCNGTGQFKQTRSERVVECRACLGRGVRRGRRPCPICQGKTFVGGSEKITYTKCYECKGTGEIELFNAAFPKMRIVNDRR